MAKRSGGEGSVGEARTVALTQEFGAQLRRMGDAGAKITQLLSMVELQRVSQSDAPSARLGTLPAEREPVAWRRLRGVIEQDLDARVEEVFADFEEKPFAIASLGQVHRARTRDGELVAVKVQHPDISDSIARDLRNIGLVTPILKRLAPGSDAGALLSEVRERITDELDYEIVAPLTDEQSRRRRCRTVPVGESGHAGIRGSRVKEAVSPIHEVQHQWPACGVGGRRRCRDLPHAPTSGSKSASSSRKRSKPSTRLVKRASLD
ncbi:MAG: AarF/UbiB family protein [Solirubrobacteraceae bacterium]